MFDLGINSGTSNKSYNMNKITIIGITILVLYSVTKILNFYSVGLDIYGSYLVFYIFLLVCYYIFNSEQPKI
jgi:uncharacterized membrane protein